MISAYLRLNIWRYFSYIFSETFFFWRPVPSCGLSGALDFLSDLPFSCKLCNYFLSKWMSSFYFLTFCPLFLNNIIWFCDLWVWIISKGQGNAESPCHRAFTLQSQELVQLQSFLFLHFDFLMARKTLGGMEVKWVAPRRINGGRNNFQAKQEAKLGLIICSAFLLKYLERTTPNCGESYQRVMINAAFFFCITTLSQMIK